MAASDETKRAPFSTLHHVTIVVRDVDASAMRLERFAEGDLCPEPACV